MQSTGALAVMMKAAEPGQVKTRLVPPLSEAEAAALYGCFIRDTFRNISALSDIDIYAAYSSCEGAPRPDAVPSGVPIIEQRGTDLGERMYNVLEALFRKGYERVAIIGSDSPDLPAAMVEDAFRLLGAGPRMVIGPATDGGYYLMALNFLTDAPFREIEWSTASVLDDTLKKAGEEGIEVELLEKWHDIDTPKDLELLRGNPGAPASAAFLKSLHV